MRSSPPCTALPHLQHHEAIVSQPQAWPLACSTTKQCRSTTTKRQSSTAHASKCRNDDVVRSISTFVVQFQQCQGSVRWVSVLGAFQNRCRRGRETIGSGRHPCISTFQACTASAHVLAAAVFLQRRHAKRMAFWQECGCASVGLGWDVWMRCSRDPGRRLEE